MANVIVIDDDRVMCKMLRKMMTTMGHQVTCAFTLGEGVAKVASSSFDVVFLDVRLPDGNGLEALPRIRDCASAPEVIILTGAGDPGGAELAIRTGAWDYIEKPTSLDELRLLVLRAAQFHEHKCARLRAVCGGKGVVALKRKGIVGNSPKMRACLDLLAQAAGSDANVLITGETGTGKELFAWAVHENSTRAEKPFVVVDCAALPETLVESVLFGHERGAFTGADRSQDGMIRQVDGGTLVLDEVGELPLSVQKAFLRVLQEHRFRPLASRQELRSDFRLVAATNRNLEKMVREGQFRNDLFFRLQSFVIELPLLKERREDIKELAVYHLTQLCERYGKGMKGISPEFIEALERYDWPGNVRELVNGLERALTVAGEEPTLYPDHLSPHIRAQVARASVGRTTSAGLPATSHGAGDPLPPLSELRRKALNELEEDYLKRLLRLTDANIQEACRVSGLSRPRLYGLMKKHGITREI